MTRCERVTAVFELREPDHTPVLGGWIACPQHIMALAGATEDEYWEDPTSVSLRAYDALGVDGLISLYVPPRREDFRCVDANSYVHADRGVSLGDAAAEIEAMPSPEKTEAQFDFEAAYADFRQPLIEMQERCGGMLWAPAQWGAGAQASWYGPFGYENYFAVIGLYPHLGQKLMEVGGARGRCHSRLIARAVEEGLYPGAVLLGEDICTQRGPMISPAFLERYWAPQLAYELEPLLEKAPAASVVWVPALSVPCAPLPLRNARDPQQDRHRAAGPAVGAGELYAVNGNRPPLVGGIPLLAVDAAPAEQ